MLSLDDNLALAKKAAQKAGNVAMSYFQTSKYEIKDKSFNNPVTTADHQANKVIKEILFQDDSSCGWLSEETVDSDNRLANDYVWVVDPIDGTKEFIDGVPQFSISIALVHLGDPIIGVIYNPSTDELFSASRSMGSYYNDKRVKCLKHNKELTALVSRSEVKKGLWDEYKNNFKNLRPIGSVAYKLALIVSCV